MAEEYVVIPPVEHQQVTTSSQVATVPRVATVFRASLGPTGGQSTSPQQHSVYRQVNRIPVVTGSRTSGSSSSFQSSPPRKVPVVYGGRPATVTPSSARPTVQYQRSSAPGHLGIKRPLEYDFSLNKKFGHSRSTDKSKGLRHFSTKVCEKVKEKGRTNYNEVADELVQEYFESLVAPGQHVKIYDKQTYDMKNIRRRVYDALNVLMAMNIIEKEKKEIRWVGLPTSSIQECKRLEEEKAKRLVRIKQKAEQVEELIVQLVAYKSLVERNRNLERNQGRPPQNTLLYLPYVVVNTDKKTMIDCSISHDKTEYLFNFDQPFEIHDDIEVLKRLGLAHGLEKHEVAEENIPKVKSYIPEALREYVDQILEGKLAGGGQEQTQPSHKIVLTAIKRPAKSSQEKIQGLAPQARAQKHPQYITLPSASHLKDPAHDYGQSGAFTQYTQALSTHSLARYAALQPTGTQKGESIDIHTYSSPSGTGPSGFGDGGGQRPVAFVVSGSGQRTPTGVGGSYQGENQWQSGGESDYSDMDSLGSNSNQGF